MRTRHVQFRALDRNTGQWHVLTIHELVNGETSSWCDIDTGTIGEYVGQQSKDGHDIYEGDVDASGCVVCIGEFTTGDDYGTQAYGAYTTDGVCTWGLDPEFPEKIVGNIHENLDLLGEQTRKWIESNL